MADNIPFLRIRIPSVKDSNEDSIKHDLNRIETFGFDLSTMTTSSDTSKCDFWYKIENKAAQPSTIIANTNGGIIPIYSNFIRSSLLFEFNIAPTSGYTNELKLNRKEEGFFVLCRDGKTYGKIIWEKSEVDAGVPDGKDGSFREYGKYFICFYQPDGSTDLSYSSPDINLENFLIDRRLR